MALSPRALFSDLGVVRDYVGTPGSTPSEVQYNAKLEMLVNAISEEIESKTGRIYMQRTVQEQREGPNSHVLMLRAWPVISITTFTIDGAAVSVSDYALDNEHGIISMRTGPILWDPYGPARIALAYEGGYAEANMPGRVLSLALDMIKLRFDEWRLGATSATSVNIGANSMIIKPGWPYHMRDTLNELARERVSW